MKHMNPISRQLISFLVCSFITTGALAQWRLSHIDLSMTGGLRFGQFTQHELIFKHRQEQGTVGTLLQLHGMAGFSNDSRHTLQAGLGYRNDAFVMNRSNFGDALFSILVIPWGGRPWNDTVPLEKVQVKVHQLSIPLAYSYRLSRRADAGVVMEARMLLMPAFRLSAQTNLTPNQFGTPLPPDLLQDLKMAYREASGGFSLMAAPEINMHIRTGAGGSGIYLGCQPLAFDLVQPIDRFIEGGTLARFTLGFRKQL